MVSGASCTSIIRCRRHEAEASRNGRSAIHFPLRVDVRGEACARASAPSENKEAMVEASIRQRVEDYAKAVGAKDLDRVMSFYASDIVSFGDDATCAEGPVAAPRHGASVRPGLSAGGSASRRVRTEEP